jgi:hypothetical protein
VRIKVLNLAKNSEIGDLSIDMQEGVGGGAYVSNYVSPSEIYQAGLEAYAGGSADIGYRGGDIIEISNNGNASNTLNGDYFRQNFVSATFSVKGDNVALVNVREYIASPNS